jgi:hypothetical protein
MLSVPFNATATGGTPPYSFSWSFGDGSPNVTGQQPTHVYTNPTGGWFKVTVTVNDSVGDHSSNHILFFPAYFSCPRPECFYFPWVFTIIALGAFVVVVLAIVALWHRRRRRMAQAWQDRVRYQQYAQGSGPRPPPAFPP